MEVEPQKRTKKHFGSLNDPINRHSFSKRKKNLTIDENREQNKMKFTQQTYKNQVLSIFYNCTPFVSLSQPFFFFFLSFIFIFRL